MACRRNGDAAIVSAGKFGAFDIRIVPGSSHYHAWVDAALGGARTADGFDYAGPLTEAVQRGNVATRMPGVTFERDSASMHIPNKPEAEKLLKRPYRDGWVIAPVV